MRRPKVSLEIDEKALRAAMARPEAKDALNGFGKLIVERFVNTFSAEDAALIGPRLKTKEGREAFRESWPKIVDACFKALCNPKR